MRPKSYNPSLSQLMHEAEEWAERRRLTNLRHTHKVRARWKAMGLNSLGKPYKRARI